MFASIRGPRRHGRRDRVRRGGRRMRTWVLGVGRKSKGEGIQGGEPLVEQKAHVRVSLFYTHGGERVRRKPGFATGHLRHSLAVARQCDATSLSVLRRMRRTSECVMTLRANRATGASASVRPGSDQARSRWADCALTEVVPGRQSQVRRLSCGRTQDRGTRG